jgi:tetratricopeptide (TPR) repeat protein
LKAIGQCEQIREQLREDAYCRARVIQHLALLYAMRGRFDEGRLLCAQSKETFDRLGLSVPSAWVAFCSAPLELLAGRPEAAEAELRATYRVLDELGERGALSNVACMLARALHDQGRDREADRYGRVAQEIVAEDDLEAQIPWRSARAAALASLGSLEKAESFAREAVALAEPTDWYMQRVEAHITLAHVLAAAGRYEDASTSARRALALENRKGNVVAAKATRAFLSDLAPLSRRIAHPRSGATPTA